MAGYGFWTGGGGGTGSGLITGSTPLNGNGDFSISQGDVVTTIPLTENGVDMNMRYNRIIASRLALNGGEPSLPNLLFVARVNNSGGIVRMERPNGTTASDPFYIGSTLDSAGFFYTATGVLSIGLASQTFSWFTNGLSVGTQSPSLRAGAKFKLQGLIDASSGGLSTGKTALDQYYPIWIDGALKYLKLYE